MNDPEPQAISRHWRGSSVKLSHSPRPPLHSPSSQRPFVDCSCCPVPGVQEPPSATTDERRRAALSGGSPQRQASRVLPSVVRQDVLVGSLLPDPKAPPSDAVCALANRTQRQESGYRAPTPARPAPDHGRHPLRGPDRDPVALSAARLRAAGDRPRILRRMAEGRHLRSTQRHPASVGAPGLRPGATPDFEPNTITRTKRSTGPGTPGAPHHQGLWRTSETT